MARASRTPAGNGSAANLGFEAELWAAADLLRGNIESAAYKHVVLGLISLKYISDAFEGGVGRPGNLDAALQQLVSKALVSDEVLDIFKVAGLKKPDLSILTDEFLAELRNKPQRNLAAEMLERLLRDEIR